MRLILEVSRHLFNVCIYCLSYVLQNLTPTSLLDIIRYERASDQFNYNLKLSKCKWLIEKINNATWLRIYAHLVPGLHRVLLMMTLYVHTFKYIHLPNPTMHQTNISQCTLCNRTAPTLNVTVRMLCTMRCGSGALQNMWDWSNVLYFTVSVQKEIM